MNRTVVIDCFHDSLPKYRKGYAIVAVDVIRSTTVAVTGVALGRKCFPVSSIEEAISLSKKLEFPILVGELGGFMPFGFDLHNSPSDLEYRTDFSRPMILLSTSGTRLICEFRDSEALYVACLRNYRALINHLSSHHPTVALLGAGTRMEFREEDQLCCAWIAEGLMRKGYQPKNKKTSTLVDRWRKAPVDAIKDGKSAAYLRSSGQEKDLEFILTHVDDLDRIYRFKNGQVVEDPIV